MEEILTLIGYITGFFDAIWTWLSETIVQILKDFSEWLAVTLFVFWIDTKIWALQFSWSIASGVLSAFNVSGLVSSYISGLPGDVGSLAAGAGFIDAFNLIAQAYVASIVLRYTGF